MTVAMWMGNGTERLFPLGFSREGVEPEDPQSTPPPTRGPMPRAGPLRVVVSHRRVSISAPSCRLNADHGIYVMPCLERRTGRSYGIATRGCLSIATLIASRAVS